MSASDALGKQFGPEFGARDQVASPHGAVSNGGWKPKAANTAAAIYSTKRLPQAKVDEWKARHKPTLS